MDKMLNQSSGMCMMEFKDARPCAASLVNVQYLDGFALTYLFARSTRITDLMAAISRAGRVLKVVIS